MAEKLTKRLVESIIPSGKLEYYWDQEVRGFALIVTPNGTKSFILNYRNAENRARRKSIGQYGQLTVEQAREIAKGLCFHIANGVDPVRDAGKLREQPTFEQVAKKFMEEHSAVKNRPATHRSNRQILDGILLPHFGKMKIRAIERRDVVDWMTKNAHRPCGANRSLACLSSIMSKAEIWEYRDRNTNPCFRIEKFPETKRERFLSEEEFGAIDAALQRAERTLSESPHVLAMIRIMMHTGCRPGEARFLKWEWVNMERKEIRLPKEATKERKPKTLFITPYLEDVLSRLARVEGNPYVIASERENGKPVQDIKKPWDRIKKAAKIKQSLHLHDLRHSHASMANSLGYSMPMIGALLGHSQVQTTLRYAHLASDHLRKAAVDISNAIAAATPKMPAPVPPGGDRPLLVAVK